MSRYPEIPKPRKHNEHKKAWNMKQVGEGESIINENAQQMNNRKEKKSTSALSRTSPGTKLRRM
jgi:hypothetical protein